MTDYYVVRPNLGQPLILTPLQLRSFEITVAGVSPKDDSPFNPQKPECPKLEEVIDALRDLQITWYTGQRFLVFPLKFREWVMQPDLYVDMDPEIWIFNPNPSEHLPFNIPVPFPRSAIEHQHLAGFRWEGRLRVGIDVPDGWQPQGGWPARCNITLKGRTNFHAVSVTETPPDPNNFKFIHLTDTHIARRNDVIPDVFCEHLEPWQKTIFLARYRNFNDHLRAVIRYANQLSTKGELDFIVLTGDVIDYYHDGYYWGDKYHFGYGPCTSTPTTPSAETSNFRMFVDIITGRDGKSDALAVPIFVLPGNHDYLPLEPFLAFDVEYETSLGAGLRLFLKLYKSITQSHLNTPYKIQEELDRYGSHNLTKVEAILFDYWKVGERRAFERDLERFYTGSWNDRLPRGKEFEVSINEALSFGHSSPHYFAQYLMDINYDTDFTFYVGNHQFVCLNTGPDVGSLGNIDDVRIWDIRDLLKNRKVIHYYPGHPHNWGFITDHEPMLNDAKEQAGSRGLVFVFTHAPFFHDKVDPELPQYGKGWHYCRTDDLKSATVTMVIDYDSAEGLFPHIGENCDKFTISFAGHTHGKAEYRVKIYNHPGEDKRLGVMCPFGPYSETLEGSQQWLTRHRPLFFISGSLKGRHPVIREIHVADKCVIEAKMNRYVPRFSQGVTAGPMACFLAAAVSHFANIAGYKCSMKKPTDPAAVYDDTVQCDRDVVMADMIDNFQLMYRHLGDIITLGGFSFTPDSITGRPEVAGQIEGYKDKAKALLDHRNLPEPDEDEEYYEKLYEIIVEIDACMKRLAGWSVVNGHEYRPPWYKHQGIIRQAGPPELVGRLLMANIFVWLNRFGLWPGSNGRDAVSLRHQFESIGYSSWYLDVACPQRIVELFQLAGQDDTNILRLWYVFESTYLAELGRYKVRERNTRDSIHRSYLQLLLTLELEGGRCNAPLHLL